MFETEERIAQLQAIIDRSFQRLGPHASLIGEPRLAPVDGHFLWGRFWFGTGSAAVRMYTWPGGNAAWVRIDPVTITTFAMDASKFPE